MHEYERTLGALNRYRDLAAEDDGQTLAPVQNVVEPGESYAGVPRLVRLLTRLGDLPADADTAEPGVYGGALVAAVKKFQARHGLEPDGRIDAPTFEQLNTPLGVRVRQLELALERWRRHPYDPAHPAIVLNLPEFRLRGFAGGDDGGGPDLDMKVVIGQAPDHETPLLRSELETVIFCPYWNVPASIQRAELFPEIVRDPSWIAANKFELITPLGEVVREPTVSGRTLMELRTGQLQLRQKPGPKNTLGLVKFQFPNRYGIYMHDTSARWLFDRVRRDLSHGCIRVEKPEELAEWILSKQPGWPEDRITAAMQGTQPVAVKVEHPIQLVTMYATAVVMEDGEVHFLPDIYEEDAALQKELASRATPKGHRADLSAFKRPLIPVRHSVEP